MVIHGKDRGKKSEVLKVFPEKGKLTLKGMKLKTIHKKPKTKDEEGKIIKVEGLIDVSNVLLIDPSKGVPTRIRIEKRDGKKVRIAVKSNKEV